MEDGEQETSGEAGSGTCCALSYVLQTYLAGSPLFGLGLGQIQPFLKYAP